jgi:YD repeat-containing protein
VRVDADDDLDLTYAYDDVENVAGITDPRPGMSQLFAYDALDRLTATSAGFYGGTLTYTYWSSPPS